MLISRHSYHRTAILPSCQIRCYTATNPCQLPLQPKKQVTPQQEQKGAWRILAALEKAKEAQGVQVAQLVASLETLLPRTDANTVTQPATTGSQMSQQQQQQQPHEQQHLPVSKDTHSSDPAFFSLPQLLTIDTAAAATTEAPLLITGNHVRELLQATRRGRRVDLHTIQFLVQQATRHFIQQPKIVTLPALQKNQHVTVIGDLHGSLSDLEAVLGLTGEPSSTNVLIFNGDLADRGDHGMEIIVLVCALVLAYPQFVYVNRGNHEDLALSIAYGLAAEVQHKYGATIFRSTLSPLLDDFFQSLPLATIVQDDALIVHGGPPPPGISLSDISTIVCLDANENQQSSSQPCGLSRTIRTQTKQHYAADDNNDAGTQQQSPLELAQEVLESMLWSDPAISSDDSVELFQTSEAICNDTQFADFQGQKGWVPNTSRGAGYKYDAHMVRQLLLQEGLVRMIRSHEPVHQGCVRYLIAGSNTTADGNSNNNHNNNNNRKMEFFTVFSASRYPHKEGFNQGAILKLHADNKHTIIRYATEDDEPRMGESFTSVNQETTYSPLCMVDTLSIRRALLDVAAHHPAALIQALQVQLSLAAAIYNNTKVPFGNIVDCFVQALHLDGTGWKKPGAQLALSKALFKKYHGATEPPQTIECSDISAFLKRLNKQVYDLHHPHHDGHDDDDDYDADMVPYYPWLRAIFEMVDVNHDGVISQAEWHQTVKHINSRLPSGTKPIDAQDTWELIDVNGDGQVSSSEWDEIGKTLCRR